MGKVYTRTAVSRDHVKIDTSFCPRPSPPSKARICPPSFVQIRLHPTSPLTQSGRVRLTFAISLQLFPASLIIFSRCSSAAVHGVFVLPFFGGGGCTAPAPATAPPSANIVGSPPPPPAPAGSVYAAVPAPVAVTLAGAIVAMFGASCGVAPAVAPDARRFRGFVGDPPVVDPTAMGC